MNCDSQDPVYNSQNNSTFSNSMTDNSFQGMFNLSTVFYINSNENVFEK